jgi:hypothetical protein
VKYVTLDELFELMPGFSDYWEAAVLDGTFGDPTTPTITNVYLALCTVVPDDTKTGATITEANYTGYARAQVTAAAMNAAAAGSKSNGTAITFAACTGGSSTVIGWALCDASGVSTGNVLAWGTCTSTVISTTQTPATVAIGGLVVTLE